LFIALVSLLLIAPSHIPGVYVWSQERDVAFHVSLATVALFAFTLGAAQRKVCERVEAGLRLAASDWALTTFDLQQVRAVIRSAAGESMTGGKKVE
jgi:hypothetical protein